MGAEGWQRHFGLHHDQRQAHVTGDVLKQTSLLHSDLLFYAHIKVNLI